MDNAEAVQSRLQEALQQRSDQRNWLATYDNVRSACSRLLDTSALGESQREELHTTRTIKALAQQLDAGDLRLAAAAAATLAAPARLLTSLDAGHAFYVLKREVTRQLPAIRGALRRPGFIEAASALAHNAVFLLCYALASDPMTAPSLGAVHEAAWPALPSIARWAAQQPATPQQLEAHGSYEPPLEALSAAELLSSMAEHVPPAPALQQTDDLVAALVAFAERLRLGHAAWSALAEECFLDEGRAREGADVQTVCGQLQEALDQTLTAAAKAQEHSGQPMAARNAAAALAVLLAMREDGESCQEWLDPSGAVHLESLALMAVPLSGRRAHFEDCLRALEHVVCRARSVAITSDALPQAVLHLACHCTAQATLVRLLPWAQRVWAPALHRKVLLLVEAQRLAERWAAAADDGHLDRDHGLITFAGDPDGDMTLGDLVFRAAEQAATLVTHSVLDSSMMSRGDATHCRAWVAAGGLQALLPFLERSASRAQQGLAAGNAGDEEEDEEEFADPGPTGMDAVIDAFDKAGGTLLGMLCKPAPQEPPDQLRIEFAAAACGALKVAHAERRLYAKLRRPTDMRLQNLVERPCWLLHACTRPTPLADGRRGSAVSTAALQGVAAFGAVPALLSAFDGLILVGALRRRQVEFGEDACPALVAVCGACPEMRPVVAAAWPDLTAALHARLQQQMYAWLRPHLKAVADAVGCSGLRHIEDVNAPRPGARQHQQQQQARWRQGRRQRAAAAAAARSSAFAAAAAAAAAAHVARDP